MRAALALIVILPLAGCVGEVGETPDFDRSCPSWFAAKGQPAWTASPGYLYNANGTSEDVKQLTDRDKWLVTPGDAGGHTYILVQKNEETGEFERQESPNEGSQTDFYDLDFNLRVVQDAKVRFQVFRSYDEEVTKEGEEVSEPTGDRLLFRDFSRPSGSQYVSELVFDAVGNDREDLIINKTFTVRVELTNGHGAANPSDIRVDAFYEGNRDGDEETDSGVIFSSTATRYYRHVDCIN